MSALIEKFRDPGRGPNSLHFEIDPDIGYKLMKGRGHSRLRVDPDCPVVVIELDEDGEAQDVVTVSDGNKVIEEMERALSALQDALAVLRSTARVSSDTPVWDEAPA